MEDYIRREEHEEFTKRMGDEHHRLNNRMKLVEEDVKEMNKLVNSVEKLATNMENMLKELEAQGKRLAILESRDGEMWRKVVGYIITAIVGIVVGYIFTQIGF